MSPTNSWPSQVDYQDALLNPHLTFADPELRTATVLDTGAFGLPLPVSGQYANVYRVRLPDDRVVAIRVFLREREGRDLTYRALQEHVTALPDIPSFLVPFRYQPEGVRIAGRCFPLLHMDWVQGVPLNTYVDSVLSKPGVLAALLEQWRELAGALRRERIAHGDLQHGNILVEPETGALRLLDYDGVFVPALGGKVRGAEIGHPAYQHPARRVSDYGLFMDRFPILVIYASLLALSRSPDLWYRLDNGDNLLFRREDFTDPDASRAFYLLTRNVDPVIRRVARALRETLKFSPSFVPDLDRFIADL